MRWNESDAVSRPQADSNGGCEPRDAYVTDQRDNGRHKPIETSTLVGT